MKEDQGSSQGLGLDQCGSRDDISLGATAALASDREMPCKLSEAELADLHGRFRNCNDGFADPIGPRPPSRLGGRS